MTAPYQMTDIGTLLNSEYSTVGENTVDSEVVGGVVDLEAAGRPHSALFVFLIDGSLADAETLAASLAVYHDDAVGMGSEELLETIATALVLITSSGATTPKVAFGFRVKNLHGAKQYIRAKSTLATSAAGTANWAAGWIMGGFRDLPATSR